MRHYYLYVPVAQLSLVLNVYLAWKVERQAERSPPGALALRRQLERKALCSPASQPVKRKGGLAYASSVHSAHRDCTPHRRWSSLRYLEGRSSPLEHQVR